MLYPDYLIVPNNDTSQVNDEAMIIIRFQSIESQLPPS